MFDVLGVSKIKKGVTVGEIGRYVSDGEDEISLKAAESRMWDDKN